ncbi:potassium-transporting ATPase subunit KdpC [Aneurinibacillus aneurinilyticus]|jgi:K+-transporting ATPase ATPase C chain|uniref:Potassium-transporting ATPase KdpC subunit n=2 Tax=Aneurinibacillus aneurinilyticus TaxID=1391 RepID=A0A848CRC5_ANEAE|nr:potassium-transporting ATPase subunit KdpC [Aneurinibacillus aneurinilyticus]MCI1694421.1 potassium-transporting ATPase subunit KdpC [Aneurinibacillus aneurinilyticus]MED0669076.1 potassium-transporting ATPase subunit KdpC [Aneurinibacillus aneurinilyticus]MED0709166.1 potassium-transporting ATPase subunit KdpC [Aneurinibacillus aneurinilyticus]MED0724146.1 potassium-transporting ATPase subunit KdpC [Aneurinibacillus aneurinilyticus]MED0735280.1 potassium-transporting ATPase subunit KdpC [A
MKSIFTAIRSSVLLMLICGLLYPLLTTGIAQVLFPYQAQGSLIEEKGKIIGSELLAQAFTSPQYFHPRASAADYNPTASAATNAAVSSEEYIQGVEASVNAVRNENPMLAKQVPADLVTTSASGLDPHLSPEAAKAQIPRIAKATGLSERTLIALVNQHTEGRQLGIFGEPRVNILTINRALQKQIK